MWQPSVWYQAGLILFGVAWIWPFLALWSRYDRLTSPSAILLASLVAVAMLASVALNNFTILLSVPVSWLSVIATNVLPVIGIVALFVAVHRMLQLKVVSKLMHTGLVAFFLVLAGSWLLQLPVFEVFFGRAYALNFVDNPFTRLLALLSAAVPTIYVLALLHLLEQYHVHLAEHVADVARFRYKGLISICNAMFSLHLAMLIVMMTVLFEFIVFPHWYELMSLVQAFSVYVLVLYLVKVRKTAPCPVEYDAITADKVANPSFSEESLLSALNAIETELQHSKSYRKRGVQLQPICHLAGVSAELAIVAIKHIQKRDFRALVYHYRLEYAKVLLLNTEMKVSAVAEKLGFNSEKYLSDMFVAYVEKEKLNHAKSNQNGAAISRE